MQVWIANEFLLLRILPGFKVLDFNFVKVDAERKIIDAIHWNLAVLPRFKVFLIRCRDYALEDSIDKLNIERRRQERI